MLEEGVLQKHFPGAHFGLVYKGAMPVTDFIGYKQITPKKVKLNGNEIYDVASLTKSCFNDNDYHQTHRRKIN